MSSYTIIMAMEKEKKAVGSLLKLSKAPTAQEALAVDAMLDLKSINKDPLKLKENKQQEIIRAAYALLDLSKIDVDVLKKQLSEIDSGIINENVNFLIQSGILPPVDVIEGGANELKRGRDEDLPVKSIQAVTPGRVTRLQSGIVSPPPIKTRENIETETEVKRQEEETLTQLEELQKRRLETLENWDGIPQLLKDLDVCEHNSASIVMHMLFPKEVVKKWTSDKNTCRAIFELSAVETQCNNVVEPKKKEDDNCYICGFEFDQNVEGLQRTCEHILPIIQAVFFLELYTNGKPITDVLRLEYDWAHRCCNYVKNDYSFLKTVMTNKYPAYEFNSNQTSVTLSLIQNLSELSEKTGKQKFVGLEHIQPKIKSNNKWKEERLKYIKETKMDPIVKYIKEKGDNGIALMIGFRNCLTTKNIHPKFLELLSESAGNIKSGPPSTKKQRTGGKTFRRNKHNGKFSTSSKRRSKKGGSNTITRTYSRK